MNQPVINEIKYKIMELDDLIINLDRLTRFKHPSIKYPRVFKDILTKYLINPKISLREMEELPNKVLATLVEEIWNNSVKKLSVQNKINMDSKIINLLDEACFNTLDAETKEAADINLDLGPIIESLNQDLIPPNLALLREFTLAYGDTKFDFAKNTNDIRESKKTKFPISKVIIAEGITEEILLPEFSNKLNYSFDKYGIHIIGAGGKSKVLPLYEKLKNLVRLPIIILLDNDALSIYEILKDRINKKDKVIIIKNGEFEDILSKNLIKRSFNNNFYDIEEVSIADLNKNESMCENIEYIYKSRNIGEFQKAHFAKIVSDNIKYETDLTEEIVHIINEIKST